MKRGILILSVLVVISGCTGNHIFPDKGFKKQVEQDYSSRGSIPQNHRLDLEVFFNANRDVRINDALMFLYAYMPLCDLADYTVDFFIDNVSLSFRAMDEMNRSDEVPSSIFLHYILPVRVNNENLDRFRMLYYEELRSRISGLGDKEAVLEINRWCHEKVTYQPADDRTSSPVKTILSARGRCGEESVFTVAALRAVGIPARQVYTPRWAHVDDNHAWVEVWLDGDWYYLGACEPEPVLDRGWFTEPARRAMMVHTKAFGRYGGSEKLIRKEKMFAEVNNLGKYAPTREIKVLVKDIDGRAAGGVPVEFCLYNYAEFFPIAKTTTDENGFCTLETGYGDLLVRTGDPSGSFGFSIISAADIDTAIITPDREPGFISRFEFNLSIPPEPEPLKPPDPALAEMNRLLNNRGDSIRNAYIGTWPSEEEAYRYAEDMGFEDPSVAEFIRKSHGNYREIISFLEKNTDVRDMAIEMLRQLSEKDLRDAEEQVLTDHLRHASRFMKMSGDSDNRLFNQYVLNPRIENELLVVWRKALEDMRGTFEEIADQIGIFEDENYYGVPISPAGVAQNKIADKRSLAIFAVAWYRSQGVPARLEPGTSIPQYFDVKWIDILLPGTGYPPGERSWVTFRNAGFIPDPGYYQHFTIARNENGFHRTLNLGYYRKITELSDSIPVIPGHYMLVTGDRQESGEILSGISFFSLLPGEHITLNIEPRKRH